LRFLTYPWGYTYPRLGTAAFFSIFICQKTERMGKQRKIHSYNRFSNFLIPNSIVEFCQIQLTTRFKFAHRIRLLNTNSMKFDQRILQIQLFHDELTPFVHIYDLTVYFVSKTFIFGIDLGQSSSYQIRPNSNFGLKYDL